MVSGEIRDLLVRGGLWILDFGDLFLFLIVWCEICLFCFCLCLLIAYFWVI